MTPSAQATVLFQKAPSPLGVVLVARKPETRGLAAILLADDEANAKAMLSGALPGLHTAESRNDRVLADALSVLITSPVSNAALLKLPLDLSGTAFQKSVWTALREIPAGTTETYSELAKRLGLESGARAIARACASNRHALAIPCHRIIRADGQLSGYRWGVERKRLILEREHEEARETRISRAA